MINGIADGILVLPESTYRISINPLSNASRTARDKGDIADIVEKSPADVAQDIPSHSEMNFIDDEDDDLDYDEDEEETTLEADDQTEKLKAAIRGKIKPVANVLDLKSFEISSSPVAFSATLNNVKRSTVRTADWALTESGKPITMKSFTGTEKIGIALYRLRPGHYPTITVKIKLVLIDRF